MAEICLSGLVRPLCSPGKCTKFVEQQKPAQNQQKYRGLSLGGVNRWKDLTSTIVTDALRQKLELLLSKLCSQRRGILFIIFVAWHTIACKSTNCSRSPLKNRMGNHVQGARHSAGLALTFEARKKKQFAPSHESAEHETITSMVEEQISLRKIPF